ncbi:unnamed protein product [Rotaria magnacalcarata]|uniref:RING-type domain-containing protein n=1 Tax=Rotaria magnacalcarata TaxID=392030 RepID=A0A816BYV0_9BILA|nr:unnamed protein product [Rotaria magnacalcarata]CAF1616594.1 unnamed protein product [Rotaria magnacalcarata]CAF1942316.1 unnamed protein product [Rotaria magnacalcarata]CAF2038687.1 unnamed protein product [Rotaria magnacalcarata]CAF2121273.1 unnamed protein product [Rotaria magnacalcarata]
MSTENDHTEPTVQPTTMLEMPSPKENTRSCGICEANIAAADAHLTCINQKCHKVTCSHCINTMIDMFFAQPTLNYPLKCGGCRTAFNKASVERVIMDEKDYEKYIACMLPLYWSRKCLNNDEELAKCPYCPYLEIHTTDACPIQFLTCQHPNCGKRSCLICSSVVQDDIDELRHRSHCVEYRHCKKLIDEAIATGSLRQCPHCELAGIKDNNCTHMTCARCSGRWCYFCGKKEEDCNAEDDEYPDLSSHNNDWESNPDRCPMYLGKICELDDRWSADDEDCLEFFHRCQTLRNLYDVLESIGEDRLEELNDQCGIIDACGYSFEDIKDEENRILIKYKWDDS